MTGLPSALLAIGMIAVLILGIGGGWLLFARRDMKRGVLMLVLAVVILANVLILALPVG